MFLVDVCHKLCCSPLTTQQGEIMGDGKLKLLEVALYEDELYQVRDFWNPILLTSSEEDINLTTWDGYKYIIPSVVALLKSYAANCGYIVYSRGVEICYIYYHLYVALRR